MSPTTTIHEQAIVLPDVRMMAEDTKIASISEHTAAGDFEQSLPWLASLPHRRIERRRLPLLPPDPPIA
ncbi:MAG TPA: hypothetical protein VFG37_04195 [Planctomycetota bacterium]|jgi:hypothetical protein|nr:hypothetical protein [Planctomycetota bacterium]